MKHSDAPPPPRLSYSELDASIAPPDTFDVWGLLHDHRDDPVAAATAFVALADGIGATAPHSAGELAVAIAVPLNDTGREVVSVDVDPWCAVQVGLFERIDHLQQLVDGATIDGEAVTLAREEARVRLDRMRAEARAFDPDETVFRVTTYKGHEFFVAPTGGAVYEALAVLAPLLVQRNAF